MGILLAMIGVFAGYRKLEAYVTLKTASPRNIVELEGGNDADSCVNSGEPDVTIQQPLKTLPDSIPSLR